MLESADLLALVRHALSNSADSLQLLIFWQTVQLDSQSSLVIGESCFKAPGTVFDQNLIEIDPNPIRRMLFLAAFGTSDVIGTKTALGCQTVCFVSNCKND